MSIFSFHAIKPITTGEGGCVVTDDAAFAEKLRLFRSHGVVKKELWNSDMISLGHNYRLTEFAAALGKSQLSRIDDFVVRRNEIAEYYDERFKGHKLFTTISISENAISSRHLYPILLIPSLHCVKEEIFTSLQERGLGVQVHFSIPCHQEMSLEDGAFVADTLLAVLEDYKRRGCSF